MQNLKLKTQLIKLSKKDRLYQLDMPLIGLTGGIACGKSTIAKLFRKLGACVIDADELVHQIYKNQETINFIQVLCPQVIENNTLDFKMLRKIFFNDADLKRKISQFVYSKLPEVFIQEVQKNKEHNFIIYDVPLLFENKLEKHMDFCITVYIPQELQEKRLMSRDHIDLSLAKKIIKSQWPIERKKQLADFVIDNSGTQNELKAKFQLLVSNIFM